MGRRAGAATSGAAVGRPVTGNRNDCEAWASGLSLACVCHLGVIVSYGLTATSGVPNEEQGLATGLVTSTQQVGIIIGIPLLGILATTSSDLLTGVHTVLAVETTIVLAAAVLVALGLRSRRTGADAAVSAAAEAEALDAR